MKKAFKAISAKEKLYQINRINSKLVHFSYQPNSLTQMHGNKTCMLDSVQNIKKLLECFEPDKNCRRYKLYLESIEQLESKLVKKDYEDITVMFGYMAGCFERFRKKQAKYISKFCEKQYHGVCIPLFQLETNLKSASKIQD